MVKFIFILCFFSSLQASQFDGLIIKFKNKKINKRMKTLFQAQNKIIPLNLEWGNYYYLKGTDQALLSIKKKIEKLPQIEYVEFNEIISVDNKFQLYDQWDTEKDSSSDPLFNSQWGLKNTGNNNWAKGGEGIDIKAPEAWRNAKGKERIIVAIVDSGIDYRHPDLQENMYINWSEKNGRPGVDDDQNGYIDDVYGYDFANNDGDPMDGLGHGTHCAGVIGAAHNSLGIAGVMDSVELMALKFLKDEGRGDTKSALKAIQYAIDQGARVISNSWGGDQRNRAMQEAIQRAREKNIFVVASAGNKHLNIDKYSKYPASYDSVITVAAINGKGDLATFSNYGKKTVLLAAPGTMIVSTWPTSFSKEYAWKTGTSMATPFVSGAIGLLLSNYPDIRYDEVIKKLKESVRPLKTLKGKVETEGLLDLQKLLR